MELLALCWFFGQNVKSASQSVTISGQLLEIWRLVYHLKILQDLKFFLTSGLDREIQ